MNTAIAEATEIKFEVLPPEVKKASTELTMPAAKAMALFVPFQKPFENAAALLAEEEKATDAASARALRLKMVKARTAITATKDESKSELNKDAKIIDFYHNEGRDLLSAAEARLREIEEEAERKETARKVALSQERTMELSAFGVDCQFYQLGDMPQEGYAQLLESSKVAFEAKKAAEAKAKEEARIAAEKAEAERIAKEKADKEERERIAAENARLKREAEEREAAAKAEREAAEKARVAAEAKAKAEKDAIEAKAGKEREEAEAKAKAEREKVEAAAKLEREAREKAEAEAKALREAAAKKEAAEAAAKAKAAKAPDKEKVAAFALSVRKLELGAMTTREGQELSEKIADQINKMADWISKQAETL